MYSKELLKHYLFNAQFQYDIVARNSVLFYFNNYSFKIKEVAKGFCFLLRLYFCRCLVAFSKSEEVFICLLGFVCSCQYNAFR